MPDYPHMYDEPSVRQAVAAEMRRQAGAEDTPAPMLTDVGTDAVELRAEIDRLTRERDRYRTAWRSARYRAAAWRQEARDDEAEAASHRFWAEHYRAQRDAAWTGASGPVEHAVVAYSQGVEDMRDAAARAAHHIAGPEAEQYVRESEVGDREPTPDTEPDDGPILSARVATLEHTIRLAATVGELHTAEDRCDDHARHVTGRLDALEARMLAAEQTIPGGGS